MVGKLGWLVLAVATAIPALPQASISGTVRSASGQPQMGAAVEIAAADARPQIVFTDAEGRYLARDLKPGVYRVRVTATSYLPTVRENVALRGGTGVIVNLTLSTLFAALQMMPQGHPVTDPEDDWKWTLRSAGNRPVLRIFDPGAAVRGERRDDEPLKASVAFLAGSDGEAMGGATPAMSTNFNVEHSLFHTGTVAFNGNVGYSGDGTPNGVFRAAYRHEFADGSHPEVALTVRRLATATTAERDAALQALSLSVENGTTIGRVDLDFGGQLDTVQFLGRVTAFRPFGTVDVHVSPDMVVEYRYATSEPTMRSAKGFETAPADLSESGPRMSLQEGAAVLERAHHHEISVARRAGKNSLQLAFYEDNIADAALNGVGQISPDSGNFLPDPYAGTFTYNGGDLRTNGVRVVAERKFTGSLSGTVVYSYGGVVSVAREGGLLDASNFVLERRHAVTAKVFGRAPHTKTRWLASYRWTSGTALTPVDLFDQSPGQSDPFLNVFLRQPLPQFGFLPGQVEALVDVRNLLAQGYVPVVGPDGQTVYLVQAPRSLRAGLAFSF